MARLRRDIVVIGGSAGAVRALREVVAHLPAEPAAAVLVATHIAPGGPARLADVLNRVGSVPAVTAADGMPITPGQLYTAVPDRHLLVGAGDVIRLSRGPRENLVRPAVDALFRSAARWYGPRVVAVVLSGTLDDGAAGLAAVAESGGVPLVLRPEDALFDGMPRAALTAVPSAAALPAHRLRPPWAARSAGAG